MFSIEIYELLLYFSGFIYLIYSIIVCYCDLYPTKYFSSNLSLKVVSKFDRYHTGLLSKIDVRVNSHDDVINNNCFKVLSIKWILIFII